MRPRPAAGCGLTSAGCRELHHSANLQRLFQTSECFVPNVALRFGIATARRRSTFMRCIAAHLPANFVGAPLFPGAIFRQHETHGLGMCHSGCFHPTSPYGRWRSQLNDNGRGVRAREQPT
jgi:hypothetical protein